MTRINIIVAASAVGILVVAALVSFLAEAPILALFGIKDRSPSLLAILVILVSLPHCFGIFRDALKLVNQQWYEVRILLITLVLVTAMHELVIAIAPKSWLTSVSLICFTAAVIPAVLAFRFVKRLPLFDRHAVASRDSVPKSSRWTP